MLSGAQRPGTRALDRRGPPGSWRGSRSSPRPAGGITNACGPGFPGLSPGWSGASPHVLRYPAAGFPPVSRLPAGFSPFARLRLVSRRPAVSGLFPSAVARFRFPSVSLRVPFPLGNLYVSAVATRFRWRWSRVAGTKVTSPAAAPRLDRHDPPRTAGGQRPARGDAATGSPAMSGASAGHRHARSNKAAEPGPSFGLRAKDGGALCSTP